jgi:ribosomal protein L7/L12
MENLLPPLIILLCVVAVVVLILRRGVKRSRESAQAAMAGGPEAAAAASAKLTEEQHRSIYSLIAQGLTVQAIAFYRQATGTKLTEARNAVLLMERHPQPFGGPETLPDASQTEPEPLARPAPEQSTQPEPVESHEPESGAPSSSFEAPSKVPAAAFGQRSTTRFPYRYRAIVSNGRQTLEVASNLLNDEIYSEIKALAQIGDAEDAAQLLWRHSEISIEEARAFVELL